MLTRRFEYTKDGTTSLFASVYVEFDYGDDQISIATDNGFYTVISKNKIIEEKHTDDGDLFVCSDGTRLSIEYLDI